METSVTKLEETIQKIQDKYGIDRVQFVGSPVLFNGSVLQAFNLLPEVNKLNEEHPKVETAKRKYKT